MIIFHNRSAFNTHIVVDSDTFMRIRSPPTNVITYVQRPPFSIKTFLSESLAMLRNGPRISRFETSLSPGQRVSVAVQSADPLKLTFGWHDKETTWFKLKEGKYSTECAEDATITVTSKIGFLYDSNGKKLNVRNGRTQRPASFIDIISDVNSTGELTMHDRPCTQINYDHDLDLKRFAQKH